MPAHVPSTAPSKRRIASSRPYRRASRMIVVDSPPGIDEPVEPVELLGQAHLDDVGAEAPQQRARARGRRPAARARRSVAPFRHGEKCRSGPVLPLARPDDDSDAPGCEQVRARALPAADFEPLALGERRGGDADHRLAEAGRDVGEDLRVGVVRRRLDDRLRAA